MKVWLVVATALAFGAVAGVGTAVQAADAPPPWAYGFTTPVPPGTPPAEPNPQQVLDNVTLHTLPGSKFSFTRAQIANRYGPADWFPEDHPAMPEIVAKGKVSAQPQVYACSLCHDPNGKGPGEWQHYRPYIRILRAADVGFPQRRQENVRSKKGQYGPHDALCQDEPLRVCRRLHVWMPRVMQAVFERFRHAIGCGHVSGLKLRRELYRGPSWRYADQVQINSTSS
jgi:hypothetical protein